MKKLMAYCSAVIFSLMLAGCGEPTLDGSSQEAIKASSQELSKDLSAEKKNQFKKALVGISMKVAMTASAEGKSQREIEDELLSTLDGKTVDETIAYFKELKAQIKKKG